MRKLVQIIVWFTCFLSNSFAFGKGIYSSKSEVRWFTDNGDTRDGVNITFHLEKQDKPYTIYDAITDSLEIILEIPEQFRSYPTKLLCCWKPAATNFFLKQNRLVKNLKDVKRISLKLSVSLPKDGRIATIFPHDSDQFTISLSMDEIHFLLWYPGSERVNKHSWCATKVRGTFKGGRRSTYQYFPDVELHSVSPIIESQNYLRQHKRAKYTEEEASKDVVKYTEEEASKDLVLKRVKYTEEEASKDLVFLSSGKVEVGPPDSVWV